MTKTTYLAPLVKLSSRIDPNVPFPTESFDKTARVIWRACKTSVRIRLALDAEWGDTHPHVLTLADDDCVVGVMKFDDAVYAKQAYDAMNNTFTSLEKWVRLAHRVRFWGYQVLSFAAVAAFVWLVLLWIG